MSWTKFDVSPTEPTLDEDKLSRIIAFDRVADELQGIAEYKCKQRPPSWVLFVPHQKVNWQDKRDRKSNQVDGQISGMQMTFTIIFEEAAHDLIAIEKRRLAPVDRIVTTLGLEIEAAWRDNVAHFDRSDRRSSEALRYREQLAATLVGEFSGLTGGGARAGVALEMDGDFPLAIVVAADDWLAGDDCSGAGHRRGLSP